MADALSSATLTHLYCPTCPPTEYLCGTPRDETNLPTSDLDEFTYRVERRVMDDERVVYVAVCNVDGVQSRGLTNNDDKRTWAMTHERLAHAPLRCVVCHDGEKVKCSRCGQKWKVPA